MKNKITITLQSDNKVNLKSANPLNFETFTNLMATAQLQFMQHILDSVPEEHLSNMKELLFDAYNEAASNLLAAFAPEIDLRPDLTEESIRHMELAYLDTLKEKITTELTEEQ